MALAWPFILIDSGERSQTKDMIIKAKRFFRSSQGKKSIHDINKMSLNLTKTLITGDYLKAAEIIQFAQHILGLSGVSTKLIDNIICESIKLGALAAKITGAGGGGSVLALLDPKYYKQQFELFQKDLAKSQSTLYSNLLKDFYDKSHTIFGFHKTLWKPWFINYIPHPNSMWPRGTNTRRHTSYSFRYSFWIRYN